MIERLVIISRLSVFLATSWSFLLLGLSDAQSTQPSYILGTGDNLRITVFDEPNLSGDFQVDASGSLSLPLIGVVPTAGLNSRDLEEAIVEKLKAGYLNNPKVTVEVSTYRPFYILGNVKSPGSYPYVSGMTVLNAIALAGGYFLSENDAIRSQRELTRARENLDLLSAGYRAAIARKARFIAERDGLKETRFPEELLVNRNDPKVAEIIESENRVIDARREAVSVATAVRQQQISQFQEEITALSARMKSNATQVKLIKLEIEDIEKLVSKGFARKTRLRALQRTAAEIEAARFQNIASISRAKHSISEVELKIINIRSAQNKEVVDELQQVQMQISDFQRRLRAAKTDLRLTEANLRGARASLLVQKDSTITITRDTSDGPKERRATENIVVFPGDIIRVPGL